MTRSADIFVIEDAFLQEGELIVTFNVPPHLWGDFETFTGPMRLTKPTGEETSVSIVAASLFTHCFGEERPGGFKIAGSILPADVPLKSTLQRI